MRILIVDDNVGLAENLAEVLDGQGYATQIAASAEEAIVMARQSEFGFLVTDFRLPGGSGFELIRSLRLAGQDPHVVVMSAHNDENTVGAARELGALFLSKPVDLGRLNHFVRDCDSGRLVVH